MGERSDKNISSLIALQKKRNKNFMDKDDDKDKDYEPPPKVLKQTSTKKTKPSKITKQLTPKQRLNRLNKKIASNKLGPVQNDAKHSDIDAAKALQSCSMANVPIAESRSNGIEVQHSPAKETKADEFSHYFEDEDVQIIPLRDDDELHQILKESANKHSQIVHSIDQNAGIGNKNSTKSIESDIERGMLASLITKVDDINGEILGLRRQIARLEAKSANVQRPNKAQSTFELDESVFLDFESTLAAEGLPIKSVRDVIAFEKRLQETAYSATPYRQKLVCITERCI